MEQFPFLFALNPGNAVSSVLLSCARSQDTTKVLATSHFKRAVLRKVCVCAVVTHQETETSLTKLLTVQKEAPLHTAAL